jgi:uncharacterized protein YggE
VHVSPSLIGAGERVGHNERVPKRGTISVVGHGRAQASPDVCRVRMTATALRPSVSLALADSEAAAMRVRDALTAGGVGPADAATGGVSIRGEEDYSGQRGPRLLGYRAEHNLEIVLRDLAAAGRLLGDAVGAGGEAVRLEGVEFAVEDDAPVRVAARAAAWNDARRAASQLAELAGRALGPGRSVGQGGGGLPVPIRARMAGLAMAAAATEVGLEPGGVSVDVTLVVVWELG